MEPLPYPNAIRFVYCVLPPFVEERTENGKKVLGGFMPPLVQAVAKWMNFSPIFIPEPDNKFGTFENGEWTGISGMVLRDKADMSMSPLIPRADFLPNVIYTNPILMEDFAMLSGKEIEKAGFFLYFSVLSPLIWMSMIVALVATAVASAAVFLNISRSSKKGWLQIIAEYMWAYFSYMMNQGANEKAALWNQKKKRVSWLITTIKMTWVIGVGFLVMNVFQSGLFSKLTIFKSVPTIDTMQDFVEKKHISTSSFKGIELQVALKSSNIPIFDKTWERVKNNLIHPAMVSNDGILTEIENNKKSIIHGFLIFENVLNERYRIKEQCNLHIAGQHFFSFPLVCQMSRRLPKSFIEKYNIGITRLIETDITGKWLKPVKLGARLCQSYFESRQGPLGIKNIHGVLILWACGIIVATLTLLMEIAFSKTGKTSITGQHISPTDKALISPKKPRGKKKPAFFKISDRS